MSAGGWGTYSLPRPLHPLAWWLWSLGLVVAASRTTNPLLLAIVTCVVTCVVYARRSDEPWALVFRFYLLAGLLIVAIRVLFRVIFGGSQPGTVLLHLPSLDLPGVSVGIQLLGDLTAEAVLSGLYDGMRLATMVICLGAANCLANPRRLLRSMPPALHEVSTALVVAMSVFPQLAESVVRVQRARQLRPATETRRLARLRAVIVSVIEEALERSLMLAASMDSRGYGRSGDRGRRTTWWIGALMVTGLIGICVGVYALLDTTTPRYLAAPMLAAGVVLGVVALAVSGRGVRRTTYRPDRWRPPELVTVAAGFVPAAVFILAVETTVLHPALWPLTWPQLGLVPLLGVLAAGVPAFMTPVPVMAEAVAT